LAVQALSLAAWGRHPGRRIEMDMPPHQTHVLVYVLAARITVSIGMMSEPVSNVSALATRDVAANARTRQNATNRFIASLRFARDGHTTDTSVSAVSHTNVNWNG